MVDHVGSISAHGTKCAAASSPAGRKSRGVRCEFRREDTNEPAQHTGKGQVPCRAQDQRRPRGGGTDITRSSRTVQARRSGDWRLRRPLAQSAHHEQEGWLWRRLKASSQKDAAWPRLPRLMQNSGTGSYGLPTSEMFAKSGLLVGSNSIPSVESTVVSGMGCPLRKQRSQHERLLGMPA